MRYLRGGLLTLGVLLLAFRAWGEATDATNRLEMTVSLRADYDWNALGVEAELVRTWYEGRGFDMMAGGKKSPEKKDVFAVGERMVAMITVTSKDWPEKNATFKDGCRLYLDWAQAEERQPASRVYIDYAGLKFDTSDHRILQFDLTALAILRRSNEADFTWKQIQNKPGKYELSAELRNLKGDTALTAKTTLTIIAEADAGLKKMAQDGGNFSDHLLFADGARRVLYYELQPSDISRSGEPRRQRIFPWYFLKNDLGRKYAGRHYEPLKETWSFGLFSFLDAWREKSSPAEFEKVIRDRLVWRQIPLQPAAKFDSAVKSVELGLDADDAPVLRVQCEKGISVLRFATYSVRDMTNVVELLDIFTDHQKYRVDLPFQPMHLQRVDLPSEDPVRYAPLAKAIFGYWKAPTEASEKAARLALQQYPEARLDFQKIARPKHEASKGSQ